MKTDPSQMMGKDTSVRGFKRVPRRHNTRSMDFEGFIKNGENPSGEFTSQTVNGTAHAGGEGWNRSQPFDAPQVEPSGPWKRGRYSNRTGE
jgi:hypothetical protein